MSVEEVVNQSKSRLEALLAPINGGVGEDVSYDEDFERMKSEVDKLQSIDGGKIEWPVLRDYGREILEGRSKDFRVALYLAAALGHTQGLDGVLDGLVLLQGLTQSFWETMYPSLQRPRARGNLVAWYSDALAPGIDAIQPSDRDTCLAIDQVSQALDRDLSEKLGDAYGYMRATREAIRRLVGRAPEPAAPPRAEPAPGAAPAEDDGEAPPTEPPPAVATSTGGGGGGPSADAITDAASAYQVLKSTSELFFKAAEVLLTASPSDADGFRYSRHGAWLVLSGPGAAEGMNAPRAEAMESVRAQFAAGSWSELANNADIVTTQSPLWLDGVRFLVLALENLGPDFAAARAAVVAETAALVARVPGLAELTFADGTPFADGDTRAWLASLAGGGGGGGAGSGGGSPMDRVARDARKLAEEDQFTQGVALLSRAVREAPTETLRFRGRLEIARLCFDFNATDVAMAQLDALERAIDHHHLRAWEPALCTQVYALSYRIQRSFFNAGTGDAETSRKLNQAFERLTELDAAEALRLASA